MGVLVGCQRAEGRGQMSEDRVLLARPLAADASVRRGITLLEVLISIGVVAVGLLGVASLIPIGSFAVNETAKADRSAALGRAAIHEVRVREMLNPRNDLGNSRWCYAQSGAQVLEPLGGTWVYNNRVLIGQPFVIDPLFSCEAAIRKGPGFFNYFPYAITPPSVPLTDLRIARLRLDIFEGSLGMIGYDTAADDDVRALWSIPQLAVFNRIFNWQDDLLFDLDEDNPDDRPRQSCFWSDQSVNPYPDLAKTENPLHAQSENNYTWMLTAVPDPNELPNNPSWTDLQNHQQKTYEVSIVTFYKRDFTCEIAVDAPSERFVDIDFQGTGIGGGDAQIGVLSNPPDNIDGKTREEAEEYLKVKENEWIMVSGIVREPRLDRIFLAITGIPDSGLRRIAKWYRVIRVDDEVESNTISGTNYFTRNITLAGPDWDDSVAQPHATIITGAIGVYTTTVTVE